MNIAPLNFEISGVKYQALPHTGFLALDLQRKVSAFYTSVFRSAEKMDDQTLFEDMTIKFGQLPAEEFKWLMEKTLEQTSVIEEGKKNFTLSNADAIAEHFSGRPFVEMYQVIFRVWELEKLGPFGLIGMAGE